MEDNVIPGVGVVTFPSRAAAKRGRSVVKLLCLDMRLQMFGHNNSLVSSKGTLQNSLVAG